LKRACVKQYPAAFGSLGLHYHKMRRYRHALNIFKQGAELNDPSSMFRLAHYHERGIALKKDPIEARRLLELAARRGSTDAISALKDRHNSGMASPTSG
jgi:TPR repeat protein